MSAVGNDRISRRYHILRALGLCCREARRASGSARAFAACLREYGRDPSAYGNLAERLHNGKARLHTARAVAQRMRYAELRRHGVPVDVALRLKKGADSTRNALRRLEQGLPLR